MLRTTATGRHLLAAGELVTDLTRLPQYAPANVDELLTIKKRAEQQELTDEQRMRWREQLAAAIAAVDAAWPSSVLPVDPPEPALAAADAWLRDVRSRFW